MLTFKQSGEFSKTTHFLNKLLSSVNLSTFDKYGKEGVAALSSATPVDSGKSANSWYYELKQTEGSISIIFHNSNIVDDVPIAIILQYGHATKNGGYVEGIDYINPAIKPIFYKMAQEAQREVKA